MPVVDDVYRVWSKNHRDHLQRERHLAVKVPRVSGNRARTLYLALSMHAGLLLHCSLYEIRRTCHHCATSAWNRRTEILVI